MIDLKVGDKVLWSYRVRTGKNNGGLTREIPATVVSLSEKLVRIEFAATNGDKMQRNVLPEALKRS